MTVLPDTGVARLPSPTVQAHAANLAQLDDGLACVWFGGTQEGVSDIAVHLSRRDPGTGVWSPAVVLSDDPSRSEQNPVLARMPGGRVWLLHTAQRGGHQDTAEVRRRVSDDGGRTWGRTEVLFAADAGGGVFVRQPPVVLGSGRILLPVFRCPVPVSGPWSGDDDTSAVMVSDDGGTTWVEREVPDSTGAVHMGIVVREDGGLWASFRSRWADHVHASVSVDDGWTWSAPRPIPLPSNNSSIQTVALGEGRLAMVLNPVRADEGTVRRSGLYDEIADDGSGLVDPGVVTEVAGARGSIPEVDGPPRRRAVWGTPRGPLSLALSPDDGRTWAVALVVADGDGDCLSNNSRDGLNRELSYPSLLPDGRGGLHVAWTHHRREIRHRHLAADVVERAFREQSARRAGVGTLGSADGQGDLGVR